MKDPEKVKFLGLRKETHPMVYQTSSIEVAMKLGIGWYFHCEVAMNLGIGYSPLLDKPMYDRGSQGSGCF